MRLQVLYPWMVITAVVVGTLVLALMIPAWRRLRSRAEAMGEEADPVLLGLLPPSWRVRIAGIAMVVSVAFMVVATTGLSWQSREVRPNRSTAGIALLFDCSQSILSQNSVSVDDPRYVFHPTLGRLGSVKQYLHILLEDMESGYTLFPIPFAGDPVTPMAPITDYALLLALLQEHDSTISPYAFEYRGTNIAGALEAAMRAMGRLDRLEKRAIVLLSDADVAGETLPDDIRAAVMEARIRGFVVYTVLVGTPGVRARIPDWESSDGWYHRRDGDTALVYSVARPDVLRDIARVAGDERRFYTAENPAALGAALEDIFSDIAFSARKEVMVWRDATYPVVAFALVFMGLAAAVWKRGRKE